MWVADFFGISKTYFRLGWNSWCEFAMIMFLSNSSEWLLEPTVDTLLPFQTGSTSIFHWFIDKKLLNEFGYICILVAKFTVSLNFIAVWSRSANENQAPRGPGLKCHFLGGEKVEFFFNGKISPLWDEHEMHLKIENPRSFSQYCFKGIRFRQALSLSHWFQWHIHYYLGFFFDISVGKSPWNLHFPLLLGTRSIYK